MNTPENITSPTLLERICSLGDAILAAFKEDTEAVLSLFHERGTLIEQLRAFHHPSEVDPNWQAYAAIITDQQRQIEGIMLIHHQQLTDTLETLVQVKQASAYYHERTTPPGMLKKKLHG